MDGLRGCKITIPNMTLPAPLLEEAQHLLSQTLVWDNHGCMPVGQPYGTEFMPQLQRYRQAGVDVAMLNVGFGEMDPESHLRTLASLRHWLLQHSDQYLIIGSAADIPLARQTGRLAVGFDLEGARAIGDQLSLIQLYYDLGVRWMLIAYNLNNQAGGGCQDDDEGLTEFGRQMVREMERVGMLVCCSHTGYRTAHDVLEMAQKPVIFSHSNPRALHAHPRNIPDELIRGCAATGGVVGLNGIRTFMGPDQPNLVENYARHIDYVVNLVGIQHVSMALDYVFDTQELQEYLTRMKHTFPPGLGYDLPFEQVAPEDLTAVVATLLGWGYSHQHLAALLGGNLFRLAQNVWR